MEDDNEYEASNHYTKCKVCGYPIYDDEVKCSNCGAPKNKNKTSKKKRG